MTGTFHVAEVYGSYTSSCDDIGQNLSIGWNEASIEIIHALLRVA